jgi:hypothetical protein
MQTPALQNRHISGPLGSTKRKQKWTSWCNIDELTMALGITGTNYYVDEFIELTDNEEDEFLMHLFNK